MDDLDIGQLDNIDFDKVEKDVAESNAKADKQAAEEVERLLEGASDCSEGGCII